MSTATENMENQKMSKVPVLHSFLASCLGFSAVAFLSWIFYSNFHIFEDINRASETVRAINDITVGENKIFSERLKKQADHTMKAFAFYRDHIKTIIWLSVFLVTIIIFRLSAVLLIIFQQCCCICPIPWPNPGAEILEITQAVGVGNTKQQKKDQVTDGFEEGQSQVISNQNVNDENENEKEENSCFGALCLLI